jgi:hypothetical protein
LKATGVINIKKTHGESESIPEELLSCSKNPQNQDLIKKEIEILEPRLVVCGGTFEYAKIINQIAQKETHTLSTGTKYFVNKSAYFIEFVHPAIRIETRIIFAYFKEMYHAFCNEINWP